MLSERAIRLRRLLNIEPNPNSDQVLVNSSTGSFADVVSTSSRNSADGGDSGSTGAQRPRPYPINANRHTRSASNLNTSN